MITFRGSDTPTLSRYDDGSNLVAYKGLESIQQGVVLEFDPLLHVMQNNEGFQLIKTVCDEEITVTGHLFGGALAQLLSVLLNVDSDPLGANLTIDYLYTFGPTPLAGSKTANNKSQSGCFAGGDFFNAWKDSSGKLRANTVDLEGVEGFSDTSMMTDKFLFLGNEPYQAHVCGKAATVSVSSVADNLSFHSPKVYGQRLGCSFGQDAQNRTAHRTSSRKKQCLVTNGMGSALGLLVLAIGCCVVFCFLVCALGRRVLHF